ncbi:MAG: crotonobetainyl-CoA:carnitine CoA-transferase CaiB-like acyl-CoA transferase [Alphaproteobacteria bacterium]
MSGFFQVASRPAFPEFVVFTVKGFAMTSSTPNTPQKSVSSKALEGIRVLDFTWVRAGPWSTRWLGALGAEIIKVEWPGNERGRLMAITPDGIEPGLNSSPTFNDTNPNKKSLTVNMRSPEGLAVIKKLVAKCDVVVENFSPKALRGWGLGYDVLKAIKPDIVYVSQSGLGHLGRQSHYTTMGPTAQAFSGLTFQSGFPDKQPAGWGWSCLDDMGGVNIAFCVMGSLHRRNKTGLGQHVDLSQVFIGATFNGPAILDATINKRELQREGFPPGNRAHWPGTALLNNYRGPTVAPHNAYRTKGDGYNDWCALACFKDEEWRALVTIMGSPSWATDEKFASLPGRLRHQTELDENIEAWTLTLDKYAVMEKCQAAGIGAMPVQSPQDRVENDPQLDHRDMFTEMDHPVLGRRKFQNAPFKMSETPAVNTSAAPLIGGHIQEVLEGMLGLSHDDVVAGLQNNIFWPKALPKFDYIDAIINGAPWSGPVEPATPPISATARYDASYKTAGKMNKGPLDGLRVLELSDEKAQYCGKLMADLGADVIKVEPPGGEATRAVGPFLDDAPNRDRSLAFWHYNTSKRGVTLNLETPEGQNLFRQLAADADVILDTFSPGYLDGLGLGFEQLRADNSKLIQCAVTPFGQTGPWRDFKAGDLTHMAAGGFMACCGYDVADDPEQTPIAPGGGNAWHTACSFAYMAISAALVARDKSGVGQFIDLSVHDSCAVSTEMHIPTYLYHDKVVIRQTGRHCQLTPNPIAQFRCADGRYVNAQGSRVPLRKFPDLVEWIDGYGMAEDLADAKYATAQGFTEYAAHIDVVIEKFAAVITRDELVHGGQARQFNWGAVCSPDELIDDGHMADRGFWVTVDHPELGRQFTYPGSAAIHNGSPWRISRRAPMVGEHNGEVFSGELGIDKDELACLAEAGVL